MIDYEYNLIGIKYDLINITDNGHKIFQFLCPLTNKKLNQSNYKRYYKKLGVRLTDLILKINNLEPEDLPLCKWCNKNRVVIVGFNRFSKGVNITSPKLSVCCSSKCNKSYSSRANLKRRLNRGEETFSHKSRKLHAKNAELTRRLRSNSLIDYRDKLKVGNPAEYSKMYSKSGSTLREGILSGKLVNHPFCKSNPNYPDIHRRISDTQLTNGTHNFLINGPYELGDLKLSSKFELDFFINNSDWISSYEYEKNRFKYYYKGKGRWYYPDLVLSRDATPPNHFLIDNKSPDVIELKSGNLYYYKGRSVELINYLKFKSIIESDLSLLVVDNDNIHKISSEDDLLKLFPSINT